MVRRKADDVDAEAGPTPLEEQHTLLPVDEPLVFHGLGNDAPADTVHVLRREHPIKRHGRPPER